MIKPGSETSEFKVSVLVNIINPILALLIMYGVVTTEEAPLWETLISSVILLFFPVISAYVTKKYTEARTALKIQEINVSAVNTTRLKGTVVAPNSDVKMVPSVGTQTSEYKLTLLLNAVNAFLSLLVVLGVITGAPYDLVQTIIASLSMLVIPGASAVATREYTASRTVLKAEQLRLGVNSDV